ncbi:hypothetical protein QPK32_15365 [Massilia sp. YIM B02763]|uniref:hypothetical protein n=1 Tax=Massilia sp. YIM B02763 TaxID=3050130 RepID=UPI0025B6859A|nr:hypothetical protein [Massilia sp. YIM B02763]
MNLALQLLLGWALIASAGSCAARSAFQQRCEEAAGRAGATFSSRDTGYRVDNSLSWRALTQLKRTAVRNGLVLGLTRAESRVSVKVDGVLLQDPEGSNECVMPQVDVTLYYPPIVIYVGSEFAPDTCSYREILAHEMRHLNTYLDFLPKVEERIRTRLARRFSGKPLYARRGQARSMLQAEIDANWMPFIKAEMMRVERLQAAIDSPVEYARLSKVCQGEVQSLIGSTRRPGA